MSVAEQAIADSRRILEAGLLDIFFPDAGGNVLAASNADFYNAFLNLVGGGEAYRNRDGSVRQNLSPRIRAAVLAAMLNPERRETVERLLDNPEGYNALINGLMQSAANLAELANKPEYDLSGELSQAVELFVETRDKGQTVDEFAAQTDMFRDAPSAETMFLMRLFEENAKSSGGISGVLRQYAAECKKIDTTTQSLFGEENPTKLEKLEEAYRHYAADLSNEAGNGNLRWRDTGEPATDNIGTYSENPDIRWREVSEPSPEEIAEANHQKADVKAKWTNPDGSMKKGYHCAPNGKPSKLTEEQWLLVRTPNFKKWFGDWETLAIINEVENMPASAIKLHESLDKAGIKEAFKSFGEVENRRDGRVVVFPSASAGKIRRHKGFDSGTVIKNFKTLFETAIPAISEEEVLKDGHKAHGNIDAVEHYVNKFSANGNEYFIRFTVPVIRNNKGLDNIHSSAISEVSIYKNGDSTLYPLNTAGSSSPSFIGRKLADFLNSVKPENVSKVVDENGEPLVVYHGSTAMFNEFRSKFIGHSTGTADGRGFYFTTDKNYAEGFKSKDGRVIEAFLNIRDTLDYKKKTITKAALKKIIKEIDRAEFEADGEHYFISNFGNYYDEGIDKVIDEATESNYDFCDTDVEIFNVLVTSGADFDLTAKAIKDVTGKDGEIVPKDNNTTHFIIFNSNQIKSATDNIGTYSENPDIRWRLDEGAAELDARHAELYERYKGGDEAAYGEALELVADEARRNGYDVKVYHGTGADGFNVADATSRYEANGEGAQAHGPGLYMAANRDTAEAYKYNAPVQEFRTIGGKTFEEIGISPKELNYPVFGLVDFLHSNGVDKAKEIINTRIESQTKRLKSAEKHLPKSKNGFDRDLAWETIKSARREISNDRITLDVIDKILSKLKESGLSISDYEYKISEGRVFDWFHNMKPDELLDEQNPNSVEKSAVGEKYKKAWFEDILPILRREYGYDGEELDSVKRMLSFHNSAKTIARNGSTILGADRFREIMLKHGIRGITYDGRQDGRAFVSFEGGATVKLQDPFTFDDDGNLIPLSERFDEANPDMRWKIDDGEALERIRKLSAADIEGIMDEAERVVSDNLKESKGRSAARVEADREKYIRDNMSKWEEGGEEDYRYYRNPKAYEISESGGEYKVEDDDGNELDFFTELEDAKRYALERRWEDDVYDELDYKEDLYEDNPQNAMRKRFEYALRKIGIEIVNSTGGTFNGSEYIYLELPNGEEKKIRFADHPQVYSADMSVEEDWRAAFKFFVERVQREDWTEENYPDNIRWKIDDPSPERVEKLRAARPVEIGENDYKGLYELNAKSAREYVLKKLRGRKYVNADTGDEIEIGQVGTKKITSHGSRNKDYLRSFAAIPQMIENAVYLGEEPNEKGNGKYDKYRYYACGLKIGGRDYTARLTIGERNGKWYYDQALTEMEKGDLIERLLKLSKPVRPLTGSPNGFIDNRLISLLQENNSENSSRLRFLLRQDRRENPVIWASIVLAKQILLGRAITSARLDRVLPPERFDGTKREYAVNRAREIAERYRADKEKFGNDLNLGVQRAENDLYWTRDVVEEMYASFRRDGEEYGIARQRLMEWLKERRRRDLETVKGLSSEELGIDVPAAIEDTLEKEPERRKPGESAAEESGVETFEASGEGIDAEIESAREKPAPSSIRDIIGKIRAGVTKAAKARGMDEAARRRAYRNTLAEVLRESAKRLTYGREREAIMKKISDLSAKGYSVIKIKDGERAGQKIDNYTLRAEHIALRIFNRGVRDTKRELSEKFEKIVSRKGKKPSRMERDDKRALAGAVQMRVYNIKRYSEMDAAELEAEYSATVDRLENVEKNFAERIRHYGAFAKTISKEIRKRAAIVQYGLPPFPASDTIQYRPLCGQSKRRKREQKSSNPKMRCITCESDKTLARLISIKLDLSLYASAPDSYCHASLAA